MSDLKKISLFNNIENPGDNKKTPLGKKLTGVTLASLALAFLSALAGLLAFALSYEAQTGYFTRGAALPVVLTVALVLVAAASLGTAVLFRKENLPVALAPIGNCGFFAATFAAFMSLFEGCFRILTVFRTEGFFGAFSAGQNRMVVLSAAFDLLSVVMAFLTAVALYVMASGKTTRKTAIAWGMIPAVRCLSGILQIFFDTSLALNLPVKLLGELALMAAVLYYLTEERMRISRNYARPALYLGASVLTLGLCGSGGISLIFFYFYYNKEFTAQPGAAHYGQICLEAVFCLLTFAYVLFRFLAYVRTAGAPRTSEPDLAESAEEHSVPDDAAEPAAESEPEKENRDEN